jgi:uncharacterized damage-inducible protein DinB
MSRLEIAISQIKRARKYTLRLLENTNPEEWYEQPTEGVTHIAWQAGHLAMAEYRLALERIRGKRDEDKDIIPDDFVARFRRESEPVPDPSLYPTPARILVVMERVHQEALRELKTLSDDALDSTPLAPAHPLFDTKLGALLWCAQHEMLHAGQIGLLRRLLGHAPLW